MARLNLLSPESAGSRFYDCWEDDPTLGMNAKAVEGASVLLMLCMHCYIACRVWEYSWCQMKDFEPTNGVWTEDQEPNLHNI